jgi:hypothetical protein
MSLKQSSKDSSGERENVGNNICWHREHDRSCLRVEMRADEVFIFPYQQFLDAHHTRQRESETVIISFSTYEITVSGRQLGEIAAALQDLSIAWIKTVPARYRGLPDNDGVWITQIDVKAVE